MAYPDIEKNRKKVLILITQLSGGGAERVVVRLANALSEKHDVIVLPIYEGRGYDVADRVRVMSLEFPSIENIRLPMMLKAFYWRIGGYLNLIRMLRRERPDVTLSFLYKPHLINLFAIGTGRKVMSERAVPKLEGCGNFTLTKLAFSFADAVVFQSDSVRKLFPKRIQKKGVIIPNPVDVSCKASGQSHKIVTAGRLMGQKNHALLIRAFASFSKTHPLHTLHIYGTGPLEDELNRLISELSMEGKVFIEGFVSNIHETIADAEQFVLSSDFEGMPNALLEAMMIGIPCITTSFLGAEEFFGSTASCLLTPVGDETSLTAAMSRLADDEKFRKELISRGLGYVSNLEIEKVIPLWERVLFNS